MLSASQFRACNFLIGKNFNTLRSQFPASDPLFPPAFLNLEIPLTVIKSTASKFLIDNFCTFHAPLLFPTSNLKSPTSSSNRPNFAVIKFPVPRSRAESALRHEPEVVRAHGLER